MAFLLLIIEIISFCSIDLLSTNPRDFFRKLIQSAHPLPELDIKDLPTVPFAEPSLNSFFYNIPVTVEEVGQYQMQNESSIAVNPKNPKVLISMAVDYRDTSAAWIYFSTDEGRTWRNKKLGRPYSNWRSSNDPSVAFSYDGIGYAVYGAFGEISDTALLFGENGVFLARTLDDCKTWEAHIPIIVHRGEQTLDSAFEDKYYISVDNSPTSPFKGNLYVPWKRVIPRDSSTQIVISKSTDKGLSWSTPIAISPRKSGSSEDTTFGQSFPLATCGPSGEVYVVWNDGIEKGIGFAKSTDGGNTFSAARIIIRYNSFGKAKYITNQGFRHTVKNKVRAEAYPSIVCDYTTGPRRGYLYLCWSADSVPNVYFSRSSDGGETWSAPKIVHSEDKNDQFWPWIAIDPTNGDLAIMYLDSRRDPQNLLVECWVSYSSDGGETWIDKPVSDVATDLRLNPFTDNSFAGDYSGCAFYNGKIYPSWVDMRNAAKNIFDSDVYTSYISIHTPNPPDNFIAKTIPETPTSIRLSWDLPRSKVFGHLLSYENLNFLLKRDGKIIAVLPSSISSFLDTGLVPYTHYKYSIASVLALDTSVEVHSAAYAGGAKNLLAPSIVSVDFDNGNTRQICVLIPKFRADSLTPIVNLSRLQVYDLDSLLFEVNLSNKDTGLVRCVDFLVSTEGFYRVRIKVVDSDGNSSDFSNEVVAFRGQVIDLGTQYYFEDFSNLNPKKYLKYFGWGYTSNFYKSAPSAMTDSPAGNYQNRTEVILGTFPFKLPTDGYVFISFENAAIIHRTDTGFVELVNEKNQSIKLANYNMESYLPWKDKVLDQSDWRKENIVLNTDEVSRQLGNNFLYLRFRLLSGTVGVDDGWYIDDLEVKHSTSIVVEQSSTNDIIFYPNPVDKYFKICSLQNYRKVTICDYFGNSLEIKPIFSSENEQLFDVSTFNPGIYFLTIEFDDQLTRKLLPFAIIR